MSGCNHSIPPQLHQNAAHMKAGVQTGKPVLALPGEAALCARRAVANG
jgi:hypothetical protein